MRDIPPQEKDKVKKSSIALMVMPMFYFRSRNKAMVSGLLGEAF